MVDVTTLRNLRTAQLKAILALIKMRWLLLISTIFSLFAGDYAQLAGNVKKNEFPAFPLNEMGKTLDTAIVLDANWRWIHNKGGYTNCYDTAWNAQFCPDPVKCAQNCELEGVDLKDYKDTYGITSSGSSLTMRYVTGSNIGSRVYVMDETKTKYKAFNLINRELVYDVDMSQLPCGLNGALYFVEMPLDGGLNALNKAGARYGVGYGDAQCPNDIKYINGFVNINNTGACSIEMDIWEANREANAFTPHSCMVNGKSIRGVYPCLDAVSCGRGDGNRYKGVCDKDGADYNSFRLGDPNLYGFGSQFKVNTEKPFRVITQFLTQDGTDNSDIVNMRRFYEQDGKVIDGGFLTTESIKGHKAKFSEVNHYDQLGGFKTMTESFRRGMTFVISIWDDASVNMLWLDSVYPPKTTEPGAKRGRCDPNDPKRADIWALRRNFPTSQYTLSNLQVRAITNYGPSPSPVPAPQPQPQPAPSPVPASGSIRCTECTIQAC